LKALKQIEARIGRTPTFRYGPRLIDLDLLYYDDQRETTIALCKGGAQLLSVADESGTSTLHRRNYYSSCPVSDLSLADRGATVILW
jgi:hypothetical protein